MQIILVHSKLKQARTLSLTRRHGVLGLILVLLVFVLGSSLLYLITWQAAAALQLPYLSHIVAAVAREDIRRQEQRQKDTLQALALKLGEMQAQITRLEALGERVSGLAGINPREFGFGKPPGRGGAEPGIVRMQDLSGFQRDLETATHDLQRQNSFLVQIEFALTERYAMRSMMPSIRPVNAGFAGSGFGWRPDPFSGHLAMHEGLDFAAPVGTPIKAAAGGIVIVAEYHPAYGYMIDLDHGNGLTTRYAHASKLHVKLGDIVRRGQMIADVGSTGRSTGSHLHFEVRINGQAQDPEKFLATTKMLPSLSATP